MIRKTDGEITLIVLGAVVAIGAIVGISIGELFDLLSPNEQPQIVARLGAETTTGTFPTSTNNFQDGDVINAGDWNNIERTIGARTSGTSTTLFHLLTAPTSVNPGHVHTSAGVSGTVSIAKGGTGTSTTPADDNVLVGDGTNYVFASIPDCGNASTSKIIYTSSTNSFSCVSDVDTGAVGFSAIAGENVILKDALYMNKEITGTMASTTDTDGADSGNCAFPAVTQGQSGGRACAQSFSTSTQFFAVQVGAVLDKDGSPAGDVLLQIRNASGSFPGEHVYGQARIASSSVPASPGGHVTSTIFFPGEANTTYWLVATSTASPSDTDYFVLNGTSNAYGSGSPAVNNSGAWVAWSGAADFQIAILSRNATAGRVYKASASNASTSDTFVGFAASTVTTGNSITVQNIGEITGFNSIVSGALYYLSNTAGLIQQATGTITKLIGIGVSTSSLRIFDIGN